MMDVVDMFHCVCYECGSLLQLVGFTADPVEDNIYQWSVKMFNFSPGR